MYVFMQIYVCVCVCVCDMCVYLCMCAAVILRFLPLTSVQHEKQTDVHIQN